METKFTPGPWSICYDGQLDGADGTRVLFLPFDSYKEFNDLPPTFKANIRLIAAAPELLAALKVLVDNGGIGPEAMFHAARAAIAKATRGGV